jgi:MFS family permease
VSLIGFCLDVFLETYSEKENVGKIRGMYLTTLNTAWVITPLIGTMIIGNSNDYRGVYVAALYMLFPLLYLVYKNFPRFKDPHYTHPSLFGTFKHVVKSRDHSKLFIVNIILQVFYSWMVVYSPIYLHTTIGFNWTQIGIILTIMLLPFPIAQWPLGKLADKKYGEKEIMVIGFALLGLATIALAGITSHNLWIWALALFMTRVGAAAAEVMIETYFFKTVSPSDSNMLGFFRVTRPLAYFIAPIITTVGFIFTTDITVLFIALGILCLCALVPIWGLKDTN